MLHFLPSFSPLPPPYYKGGEGGTTYTNGQLRSPRGTPHSVVYPLSLRGENPWRLKVYDTASHAGPGCGVLLWRAQCKRCCGVLWRMKCIRCCGVCSVNRAVAACCGVWSVNVAVAGCCVNIAVAVCCGMWSVNVAVACAVQTLLWRVKCKRCCGGLLWRVQCKRCCGVLLWRVQCKRCCGVLLWRVQCKRCCGGYCGVCCCCTLLLRIYRVVLNFCYTFISRNVCDFLQQIENFL